MIPVMCVVQEGQISPEVETSLKSEIEALSQQVFQEHADIDWIVVPTGSGFTAARPSRTLIASLQSNRPLGQEERVSVLKALSAICMANTGRSANEVVTSVRDPH